MFELFSFHTRQICTCACLKHLIPTTECLKHGNPTTESCRTAKQHKRPFLVQSLFMQLQGWRVKIITQAETCLKWPSTDSQIHVLTVKIGQWGCALLSAAFSWFFHLIVILGWTAPLARLDILAYRQLPSPFGLNFCFADSDSSGICSKVKGWSGIGA